MLNRLESLRIKAKLLQKAKKKSGSPIKLKEAYDIIARSAGYQSWREQKKAIDDSSFLSKIKKGSTLNLWFHDYDEAKDYLKKKGGILLPFEKDFVIISEDDLKDLGVMPDDPDLKRAGHDFFKPGDKEALERILQKLKNGDDNG